MIGIRDISSNVLHSEANLPKRFSTYYFPLMECKNGIQILGIKN